MLVRFDSKVGTITMFGEVATNLLKLMGQTGTLPGAILAQDISAALERLRKAVAGTPEKAGAQNRSKDDEPPPVNLRQRAFPLIELLERAAKEGADVIWEEERRTNL